MLDSKKILEAWERCKICDLSVIASAEASKAYRDCEYTTGLYCRRDKLILDTINLLKDLEMKKGEWIEKEDYNLDTYYDCSVCGESWMTIEGTPWENGMNYCPNCGAKMKGLKTENDT